MSAHPSERGKRRGAYALLGAFVLLAAGIVAAGYLSYRNYERRFRVEVERQLSAVADLKVGDLVQWRRERLADGTALATNTVFSGLVRQWVKGPNDAVAGQLRTWLGSVQASEDYERIILVDARGVPRMSVPGTPEPVDPYLLLDVPEVLRSGRVSFVDFHRETPDAEPHLAVLVPIQDGVEKRGLAVLVLLIDPERYLYPLLQRWPTPSRTSETLLVRREGDVVLFLNELRFQANTALTLRRPLTTRDLPAARAALGEEGVAEGVDYRGVPAVAAMRSVPDSPWFLVARTDTAEVYSPLRQRLWQTVAFLAVLLLAAGALVGLVWRQQGIRSALQRYEATNALNESETRLRHIAESANDVIYEWDLQQSVQWFGRIDELLGYAPGEFPRTLLAWKDSLHPEDRDRVLAALDTHLADRAPYSIEYRIRDQRGAYRWWAARGVAVRSPDGPPTSLVGTVTDITERKMAEDALRSSQRMIEGIINAIPVRIFWKDKDLFYLGCNVAFARDAGMADPKDVIGKDDYQMGWRDQAESFRGDDRRVIEYGRSTGLVEEPRTTPEGHTITLLTSKMPLRGSDGEVSGVLGTYVDITERKREDEQRERALHEVRESETRYRRLVENIREIVFAGGLEGPPMARRLTFVSPQIEGVAGRTAQDFLADPGLWGRLLHPDDVTNVAMETERALARGEPVVRFYRLRNERTGEYRWIEDTFVPDHDDDGAMRGFFATARDVTARWSAEAEAARLRRRNELLLDCAGEGIFGLDLEGIITFMNPTGARLLGYAADELIAAPMHATCHQTRADGRPFPPKDCPIDAAFRDGSVHSVDDDVMWRKDGVAVPVEYVSTPMRDEQGDLAGAVVVFRDITERRRLEGVVQQSQKLEAVGRLAGGIAHDFNNILAVIIGYGNLMRRQIAAEHPARPRLEQVLKAAERAAGLTRQLLAFSRKQVIQPRILDLGVLASDLDKMLRRVIGEDVELEVRQTPDLGSVKADPTQLEQVILNLVVNARDAMPKGGHVTIETANAEFDEASAAAHPPAEAGRFVMLAVSDTGIGMDVQTQQRMFEPFFTTKPPGEGSGLGLATVYGVVKQSGGFISAYSEPGRGTTFKVYLPRVDEQPEALGTGTGPAPVPRGRETVLLVEDTESLREVICEVLEEQGYTVLQASHGQEALAVAREHQGPIHLLLTDLVMPKLGGADLAKQLASLMPLMRVLYMSGYTEDAISRQGVLRAGSVLLEKPFTPDRLARAVREALDAG